MWSVDTNFLIPDLRKIFLVDIAQTVVKGLHDYTADSWGISVMNPRSIGIAGLEGVNGWRLQFPAQQPHGFQPVAGSCLSEIVTANGTYDLKETPGVALRPFFDQIFRKCATQCPQFIKEFIEKPLV